VKTSSETSLCVPSEFGFPLNNSRTVLQLKVDDVSALNADEQGAEDEISDPEEDSLAGQMAAMRGGTVKKSNVHVEESDDESSTDDEKESRHSSSDSD
jgi:translocation protein SEC63